MDPVLRKKLDQLGEHIKQKRGSQPPTAAADPPAAAQPAQPQALVIPFKEPWAEALRAAPLALLRSALFGVVRRGRRQYLENAELLAA